MWPWALRSWIQYLPLTTTSRPLTLATSTSQTRFPDAVCAALGRADPRSSQAWNFSMTMARNPKDPWILDDFSIINILV